MTRLLETRLVGAPLVGLLAACALGCTSGGSGNAQASDSDSTGTPLEVYRSSVAYDPTLSATDTELAAESVAAWDFTARVYKELGATNLEPGFISPYSLRAAFGMLRAGSSGAERDNLDTVFGFAADDEVHLRTSAVIDSGLAERNHVAESADSDTPDLVLTRGNALFCELADAEQTPTTFLDRLSKYFDAGVVLAPVRSNKEAAKAQINGWVSDRTNGKIPDLLPSVDEDAWLVLVNALYFKASWATAFVESETEPHDFSVAAGNTVSVSMMHHGLYPAGYAAGDDYVAVALPYSDPQLELVVVLPNPGEDAAFAQALSGERLRSIAAALQPSVVDLALPKLTRPGSTSDLFSLLATLGLNGSAQYQGVHPAGPSILQVFHRVFIALDEKGTEAAAATAIVMGDDGGGPSEADATVVVDRPYYVFIHDRVLGVPLFFGRVNDPS